MEEESENNDGEVEVETKTQWVFCFFFFVVRNFHKKLGKIATEETTNNMFGFSWRGNMSQKMFVGGVRR